MGWTCLSRSIHDAGDGEDADYLVLGNLWSHQASRASLELDSNRSNRSPPPIRNLSWLSAESHLIACAAYSSMAAMEWWFGPG